VRQVRWAVAMLSTAHRQQPAHRGFAGGRAAGGANGQPSPMHGASTPL